MKIHLLLLALVLCAWPVRGDVAIYAGSATQQRPGVKHRTSRAFLVVELDAGTPHVAVLLGGANAGHGFTATYDQAEVIDENGFQFEHLYASAVDPSIAETHLDLVSNYTKDSTSLLLPRKYSGRLAKTQFGTFVVYILIPGEPPPHIQPNDFSDISLVFSLDQHRTNTAHAAGSTFDAVVAALKAQL